MFNSVYSTTGSSLRRHMLQLRTAPGARGLLTANAVHHVVEAHRHELARALKEQGKSCVREMTSKAELAMPSHAQVESLSHEIFFILNYFKFGCN